MAELLRSHPLEAWTTALAALPESAAIGVEPFVAMADVRVGAENAATASGLGLPAVPNTWVSVDGGRAIWLGPDEWLVTSASASPAELVTRVRGDVQHAGGAVTDVSAQRITLRLTGSHARDLLAKGCSIDLHPTVFGRGSSAQTTLGHTAIVLLALSDTGDAYAVLVRSSFAGHLASWLLDAAIEYV